MLDGSGRVIEPIGSFLRDRMLGDASPLSCRSYAYDLLRLFRVLWTVEIDWEQATEAELLAHQKVSDPPGTANWRTRPRRIGDAAGEGQGTTASRTAATHAVSSPGTAWWRPESGNLDPPGLGAHRG
ncbi:hypothetical protein K7711_46650 [Nocardia sp. CA2R105]|uniref:hypothetical protein n=1 Tax=Nocardia coffeae TaxID=2873381 RepID=UPI001CA7782A|nr:hypothetical protein [Nocardia coffeae]MBY8864013.1 hypothetical protein [Nocardia coffeae]